MVYTIKDWDGQLHQMTAQDLCERIKDDSKSDYNWLASAPELTRVTGIPGFDKDCAIKIRSLILNCFASIEHKKNNAGGGGSVSEDTKRAIQECYNSLFDIEVEEAVAARKRFLTEMIEATTHAEDCFDYVAHPGESFHRFRDKWVQAKSSEYFEKDFIDFGDLHQTLRPEWLKLKEEAEKCEDFKEDDEKFWAKMRKVISEIFKKE